MSGAVFPGWVLPYNVSDIGMCRPKGYGFCSVFVRKRVYTLSISVWNRRYGLLGNYGSVKTYLPFQYEMSKKLKKKFANSKWILKEIFFVGVLIYVMMT